MLLYAGSWMQPEQKTTNDEASTSSREGKRREGGEGAINFRPGEIGPFTHGGLLKTLQCSVDK